MLTVNPAPSPQIYPTPSQVYLPLLLRYTYPFPSGIPYLSPQVYPTYPLRYTLPTSPQVHPTLSPKRDMGPVTSDQEWTWDQRYPIPSGRDMEPVYQNVKSPIITPLALT